MHCMLWILQSLCLHARAPACALWCQQPTKKPAALASGLFCEVLDGDSYAITVLRQNVSAAVTFIFLFAVHEVLV